MAKVIQVEGGELTVDVELVMDDGRLEVPLELIDELTIVEDVDFLTPTGNIIITEHMSEYSGVLEITGNERLQIQVVEKVGSKPTDSYRMDFNIFNASFTPWGTDNPYKQVLNMNLVHPALFDLVGFQLNGGYSGKTPSEIVPLVLEESGYQGETFIEPTNNRTDFIIPYWTPAFSLKQLASKSVAGDGTSGFLVFHDGRRLNYCSINHLLRQPTKERIKYWGEREKDYVVSDYKVTPFDRTFTMVGALGITAAGYSFREERYIRHEASPKNIGKKYLGTRLPIKNDDELDSLGRFLYTGEKDEEGVRVVAANRLSNMLESLVRANVTVEGLLPRVHAGDMVEWVFPSKRDNTTYNAKYSGPWLVKRRVLYFADNHIRTGLLLVRNAYQSSRDGVKV